MIVVCDSTPLIYLAAIGKFDLLRTLYGRIGIPNAVFEEVVTHGGGRWGAAETAMAGWIDRHTIADPAKAIKLQTHLHGGESEVIVLAEEVHADLVIIDESAARRELALRGVAFIGTVGTLIEARKRGAVAALRPELDHLRTCGFHLSNRVYQACLRYVGE